MPLPAGIGNKLLLKNFSVHPNSDLSPKLKKAIRCRRLNNNKNFNNNMKLMMLDEK
jgi:hypothetical protein